MKRQREKLYTAGSFAKLAGISKDTLFFYDRIGLFRPMGRKSNGYRYYSLQQLPMLNTILAFRNMDLPIEKILEYLSGKTPDTLLSLLDIERRRINERIAELRDIRRTIDKVVSSIREAEEKAGQTTEIRYFDRTAIIESSTQELGKVENDEIWLTMYSSMSGRGIRDISMTGSRIALDSILTGAMKIKSAFIESDDHASAVIPEGPYAVTYFKGPYAMLDEAYLSFLKDIEKAGYKPCSDAFEEYVVDELATDNENEFVTRIRIMVSKN